MVVSIPVLVLLKRESRTLVMELSVEFRRMSQVTVVFGGGIPCFRTTDTMLQAAFRHRCGVDVMVGDKPFACQQVISTQVHSIVGR